jgi:hypothetical protein
MRFHNTNDIQLKLYKTELMENNRKPTINCQGITVDSASAKLNKASVMTEVLTRTDRGTKANKNFTYWK